MPCLSRASHAPSASAGSSRAGSELSEKAAECTKQAGLPTRVTAEALKRCVLGVFLLESLAHGGGSQPSPRPAGCCGIAAAAALLRGRRGVISVCQEQRWRLLGGEGKPNIKPHAGGRGVFPPSQLTRCTTSPLSSRNPTCKPR